MELSQKLADNTKKQISLTVEKSEKIKNNLSTKKILYEDYPEAFDYVGRIFPDIDVRSIDVRQATPLLLSKLGYDGIGGFFERVTKTVVVAAHQLVSVNSGRFSVKAKLHRDEVVVHELLHYCHHTLGHNSSVNLKEEFAYGWSYGYLKSKGYTDEEIISDNYLPYLYNVCYKDGFFNVINNSNLTVEKLRKVSPAVRERLITPLKSRIHKEVRRLATEKGKEIIRIFSERINEGQTYRNINKIKTTVFDTLDLD
jgi:hypothetical protein